MISRVFAIFLCVAASGICFARKEETLSELMAKADAASGAQQADLCMQVAERQMKLAIESFNQNKPDSGRAALEQISKYADKGHSAAIQARKRLKHTEIKLRQISGHLRDFKFNANADDQPVVQATIDKLEAYRTELLKSMFGSKSND